MMDTLGSDAADAVATAPAAVFPEDIAPALAALADQPPQPIIRLTWRQRMTGILVDRFGGKPPTDRTRTSADAMKWQEIQRIMAMSRREILRIAGIGYQPKEPATTADFAALGRAEMKRRRKARAATGHNPVLL